MNAPIDDNGPTLGELSRQLQALLIKFDALIKDMDQKYVSKELYTAEKTAWNLKIAGLEDNNKWLVRTIIGLVLSLTIAAVFAASGGKV